MTCNVILIKLPYYVILCNVILVKLLCLLYYVMSFYKPS
jgi:hypothetical protein